MWLASRRLSGNGPHVFWRIEPAGFSRVGAGALELRQLHRDPSIHGIFQTILSEWGASAFSEFRWLHVVNYMIASEAYNKLKQQVRGSSFLTWDEKRPLFQEISLKLF